MTPAIDAIRAAMREDIATFAKDEMVLWPSPDNLPDGALARLSRKLGVNIDAYAIIIDDAIIAQASVGSARDRVVIDLDADPFLEARPSRRHVFSSETEAVLALSDPEEMIELIFDSEAPTVLHTMRALSVSLAAPANTSARAITIEQHALTPA